MREFNPLRCPSARWTASRWRIGRSDARPLADLSAARRYGAATSCAERAGRPDRISPRRLKPIVSSSPTPFSPGRAPRPNLPPEIETHQWISFQITVIWGAPTESPPGD